MTQATRKQLKPALSKHTCQSAALLPQHGFSQLDLQIKYSDREKEKRTISELQNHKHKTAGVYFHTYLLTPQVGMKTQVYFYIQVYFYFYLYVKV